MATYVYAITAEGPGLGLEGVRGVGEPAAELRTVAGGGLVAVASEAPQTLRAKRRDVLAHQSVIERLMDEGPVLPMRFGLVGESDEGLRSALTEQSAHYRAQLEDVGACVEYHLKATRDEDDLLREIVTESAEARRLHERSSQEGSTHQDKLELGELLAQEVRSRHEAEGQSLIARLAPAARRVAVSAPGEGHFAAVSFLVDRGHSAIFSRTVQEQADQLGAGYTLRLSGPLPPYSFV